MIFVILLLGSIIFFMEGSHTDINKSKYKSLYYMMDTNFSSRTIWVDKAKSLVHCGLKCHEDTNCKSYGYNDITKTCQGHRQCFLTKHSDPYITTTAARYFVIDDRHCTKNVSEDKIIWRVCYPSIPFHKYIDQQLLGRMIVIEGIFESFSKFIVAIYSNLSNYGFFLNFEHKTNEKVILTAIKNNTIWRDGIHHYRGTGGPALDSLFCLEVLITTTAYKVLFNNEYLLERNISNNFEKNNKVVIYALQTFIPYEVSVIVD